MLSLRAAAAELETSRKRLGRMIRDGLPVTRRDERVFIDIAKARTWIAENETKGRKIAPALHPDDPRFRERTAAAAIAELKAAANRAELLAVKEIAARVESEVTALRDEMFALASRLHLGACTSADEIERSLGAEIGDVLSHLTADAHDAWPEPQPAPDDLSWLDDNDDSEDGETLPLLVSPDPRHAFAAAQADKRKSELVDLQARYIGHGDTIEFLRSTYGAIRERVRAIPAGVALALDARSNSASDVRRAIDSEVEEALSDIRAACGGDGDEDSTDDFG